MFPTNTNGPTVAVIDQSVILFITMPKYTEDDYRETSGRIGKSNVYVCLGKAIGSRQRR